MSAIPINIKAERGTDFSATFTLRDEYGEYINLNSFSVTATYSNSYVSTNKNQFVTTVIHPLQGIIEIRLTAAQTSALKLPRYVYDIVVTSPVNIGGTKFRVVEGIMEVSPGVTV
jgi:hypothetical protein